MHNMRIDVSVDKVVIKLKKIYCIVLRFINDVLALYFLILVICKLIYFQCNIFKLLYLCLKNYV